MWEFRYRDNSEPGRPQRQITFGADEYPTEAEAWRHVEALVWKLNAETPQNVVQELTFGTVCDVFIREEHLEEISQLKPGQVNEYGDLKVSTARGYLQMIRNHIRPKWGATPITDVKAAPVTEWLKRMEVQGNTKAHIKALMSRLFKKAMLWEMIELQTNPMSLVEVRGASKRRLKPVVLTVEQCTGLREALQEPFRTMLLIAQCTGLRVSEILALKWEDVNFDALSLRVCRAVVRGIVDDVKTEYSEDELPLDPDFATELLKWKRACPPSADGWVFPSPVTRRPYEPGTIQQKYIREAGKKLGLSKVGWHAFRHTYRSLLDSNGAPVGVQQKLMRHAQVSTTMNVYGNAQMVAKREANSKVVSILMKGA